MGLIANIAGRSNVQLKIAPERGQSRVVWQTVFGTSKEDGGTYSLKPTPVANPRSYQSLTGTDASIKRLVEAMRSRAPGNWSDDRLEQSRHFNGVSYVAIHRTCEQLSQSEFQVYHKDDKHPDGKRAVTPNEPEYELVRLLEHPNNEDSWGQLMYQWGQQMSLCGQALTWMVPNVLGKPYELYSIPTALAIPGAIMTPEYPDGYWQIQPVYPYGPFSTFPSPQSAVGARIPGQWMMRFKFPHPLLRYDGYSPMTALRLHIDEVEMIDRSRHYTVRRAINPSAVLNFEGDDTSAPLPEPEIERIRAEFEAQFMGPENAGQLFVASPGAKLEQWGAYPKDMDYTAGWDQLVSFVMGGFGITKPAAGMIEDSSYSTLFASLKQFHLLTLKPLADRIAAKLTRQLAPFFGPDLIIEIRLPRIDDHEVTFNKISTAQAAKCITKNQVLKLLELPVTTQPWGEELAGEMGPASMMAMGMMPTPDGGMMPIPGTIPGMPAGVPGGVPGVPPGQQMGAPAQQPPLPSDPVELVAMMEEAQLEAEGADPTEERPTLGNLGRGALGPRKSIKQILQERGRGLNGHTKSMYESMRGHLNNGHR